MVLLVLVLTACVSRGDIDAGFRRIDRAWQLEYQQTEDEYRFRVIDAEFAPSFEAVRKTFLDLGLPIQKSSLEGGVIVAENAAPAPLSLDEWKEVARAENPRVKEIG